MFRAAPHLGEKSSKLHLEWLLCFLSFWSFAAVMAQPDSNRQQRPRAHQLMLENIEFYLDESVLVQTDRGLVAWKDSERSVLQKLEQIVRQVASLQTLDSEMSRFSFSDEVVALIHYVSGLDHRDLRRWRMAEGLTEAEQWYVLTQSALDELKMQIAMELNVHLNPTLFEQIERDFIDQSDGQGKPSDEMDMEEWLVFDPNRSLPAAPMEWSDASNRSLSELDRSSFFILPETGSPSDWESWMQKLVQLMEMQEMRIRALETGRNSVNSEGFGPVSFPWKESGLQLPDRMDISFRSGSYDLDLNAKLRLNEVMGILCRHPEIRLVCTGFADASGERSANLDLSKRRAQIVRDYILQSGVRTDRVLLNYYGEEEMGGAGNNQRLVKIQFFMD